MPNRNETPGDPAGSSMARTRVLLPAGVPSVEMILNLYRKLTGREPTPEERAEVERTLAEGAARRPSDTTSPAE